MVSYSTNLTGNEVVDYFKDRVNGKTIVITGASAGGLGAETALSLAVATPAHLILLARSRDKVQPVLDEIRQRNDKIKVEFIPIELDKSQSVKDAANKICATSPHVDILINNAGIMAVPYARNDAGIEMQLATNHIGHFLLTNWLMDKIKAAPDGARIVNLTSDGYMLAPFFFDDYNFSDGKKYHEWSGYGQSKTANILFSRSLALKLPTDRIQSYSVHPGVIMGTNLSTGMDTALFNELNDIAIQNTGQPFGMGRVKSKQEGVATTLVAALDPQITDKTGAYLVDSQVAEARDYAFSEENAERLWVLSEELTGHKFSI